ncbi:MULTISPECIES: aminoacyl-tRNA hydrolase [unclassified Aureimonas]|uniref:aminoacyl-tRNA hydrolase n=1 Tax=unclassified Aureimonas TaxID=2615206 RepID=UPI0006F1FBF7|nr:MULTISPECIES: aminoacyl-tRNA hydrolase [unclassified Aureimonas]KQT66129.1 peptidyl-tRNA hydrolase [Aureimonas sp. Leaf427]KQT81007.1 peptidyl-tRNA hydrolase [Aureimonas sp. Leaf460]
MLLIVGLGNPGPSYAGHRHNIGFMAVDEIRRRGGFSPWTKKFKGEISEGQIGTEKVLLLKPLTFMNDSGASVGDALRFYKLEPSQVVVVHDELDISAGKVRVKTGGGNGGHNGLRSIDAHIGKDYRRVRLGIGHPGSKERVNGHVLSDFHKVDREWLDPLIEEIARHADLLVAGEDAQFMNRLAMVTGSTEPASAKGSAAPLAARPAPAKVPPKGKSHIRQARSDMPKAAPSGAMADMLKRLFGGKD